MYLDRQQADIASYRRDEGAELPDALDYRAMSGISNEIKAKLDLDSSPFHWPGRTHRRHDAGGPGADRGARPQGALITRDAFSRERAERVLRYTFRMISPTDSSDRDRALALCPVST